MPAQNQQKTVALEVLSTDPDYVGQQLELLEATATVALSRGIARRAMADSLRAFAAANGITFERLVGAELAAQHADADGDLQIYARALAALRNGQGEVVRWHRSETAPVFWGIHKPNATLGLWPFVATVIIIAGVISATAWWLSDTVGAASRISADAQLLRQKTIAELLARAKSLRAQGKVSQADKLEQAASGAVRAAEAPPPGILDSILTGAGAIAVTGAGIGVGALALMFFLSRRKGGGSSKKRRYRSPVTFHKPVAFRSPVH